MWDLGGWGVRCVQRLRELNYAEVNEVVLGGAVGGRPGRSRGCISQRAAPTLSFSLLLSQLQPWLAVFLLVFFLCCAPPHLLLSRYISDTEHL